MDYYISNGELYHWGVKGMKWGVRRDKTGNSHSTSNREKTLSVEELTAYAKSKITNELVTDSHRNWMKKLNDAYEKWYENHGPNNAELKKQYETLAYEHPEAKRYSKHRDNFVYDQASTNLKKTLDEAKANNDIVQWALDRNGVFKEWDSLCVAYDDAYNSVMFDDLKHFELRHWGIKGMKWGVRRFQNKDGSLTKAGRKRYANDEAEDTVEARREKLLKSTNAEELFKNRSLLTTAEMNERLNRIDTERRLSEAADKRAYERVDKILKAGKKINEVYEFTNTSVMKALKKKMGLGGSDEPKRTDLKNVLDKLDSLSDKKLNEVLTRAKKESELKKILSGENKGSKKSESSVDMDDIKAYVEELFEELAGDK
jgi:hypothetical protein